MTDETRDFLARLFGDLSGWFELTYIDPKGHYGLTPAVFSEGYEIGTHRINWDRVAEFNRKGYGVYYGLTTKRKPPAKGSRATERDAFIIPCLWAEVDLKAGVYDTLGEIQRALLALSEPPTTIIFSGGGLHALWKIAPVMVNKANFVQIKESLRGLAVAIKGDTSVAELARVFRLPGSVNTKADRGGVVCRVMQHSPAVYQLDDFDHYRQFAKPIRNKPARSSHNIPDAMPDYIKWFFRHPHPPATRNNAVYWTACMMWEDGFSLSDAESMLLDHAMAIGQSEKESLATIRSRYKKG
ncbi:MAG: DNA-primase RepB domain-containing protein [Planctomycetota bacterium]|jgi:hypothetical protein